MQTVESLQKLSSQVLCSTRHGHFQFVLFPALHWAHSTSDTTEFSPRFCWIFASGILGYIEGKNWFLPENTVFFPRYSAP